MGLSYRGNTKKKGNNLWVNYSASSRGLHGSVSYKPSKAVTLNHGKHGNRVTINLGNGLRWTSYRKRERKETEDYTIGQLLKYILYIIGFVFGLFVLLIILSV